MTPPVCCPGSSDLITSQMLRPPFSKIAKSAPISPENVIIPDPEEIVPPGAKSRFWVSVIPCFYYTLFLPIFEFFRVADFILQFQSAGAGHTYHRRCCQVCPRCQP